jgi:hypothetical protein
VVILPSLVEVSASHVQVKVKNEMVVTFISGSLRSVSHEEAGGDGTPHVGEVQARLQKLSQYLVHRMLIPPSARTVLADMSRPQVYHRDWTVGRLLADMSSASLFDHAKIVQIIVSLGESILTT